MYFNEEVTNYLGVLNLLAEFKWNGTCSVIFKQYISYSLPNLMEDCKMTKLKSGYSSRQFHSYGFLLLFTILLPISMSIPLRGKRSSDKSSIEDYSGVPTSSEASAEETMAFINSTLTTARLARHQAMNFAEDYVKSTFHVDFQTHHNNWKSQNNSWLRENFKFPKDLLENVTKQHLDSIVINDELISIHAFLHRLSIAFKQIIADNRNDSFSKFEKEFETADDYLKEIIRESADLIQSLGLTVPKVEGVELPPMFRHMNVTHRYLRDWLVFRDYLNLVEYITQVMEYFRAKTD